MIEILINKYEWESSKKSKRLTEIVKKLKKFGWNKFGHDGTIVLFKDISKERAKKELIQLGINEIEPEEWDENLYSNNII